VVLVVGKLSSLRTAFCQVQMKELQTTNPGVREASLGHSD